MCADSVYENYCSVRQTIDQLAIESGRQPQEVHLIVVSKTWPLERLYPLMEKGIFVFGENKVQEILSKQAQIAQDGQIDPESVRWHLIGTLQKNKVRQIVGLVDLIHSVDSLELLQEIEKRSEQKGLIQAVLLQVNLSGEETKHGFSREEIDQALELAQTLSHVRVRGLMTMAPSQTKATPQEVESVFRQAKDLYEKCQQKFLSLEMDTLSMGMSQDYPLAIRSGATHVRVGSAIFGSRDYFTKG